MRPTPFSPLTVFWKLACPAPLMGGMSHAIAKRLHGEFRNDKGTALPFGKLVLAAVLSPAAVAWPVWWGARLGRVGG
jgi:hypothetical protein